MIDNLPDEIWIETPLVLTDPVVYSTPPCSSLPTVRYIRADLAPSGTSVQQTPVHDTQPDLLPTDCTLSGDDVGEAVENADYHLRVLEAYADGEPTHEIDGEKAVVVPVDQIYMLRTYLKTLLRAAQQHEDLRSLTLDLLCEKMNAAQCAATTPAVSQWQPIETAPRDGTVILLRCGLERLCGYAPDIRPKKEIAVGYYDKWWVIGVPGGHSEGGGDTQFTHWMPLPVPPKEKA